MNLKILCILFFLVLDALSAFASSTYLTFVDAESGSAIQESEVSFTLDKKNLPIDDFFLVDTADRPEQILWNPAGRRQYVLLLDLTFSTAEQLLEARKLAQDFLSRMNHEDLVAVAGISKKGLQIFTGFTRDRNQIHAGFNSIGKVDVAGLVAGPDGNLYPATFPDNPTEIPMIPDNEFMVNVTNLMGSGESKEKQKKQDDIRPAFVQAISDLAYTMATVEGRKNVILFSPGFSLEGIQRAKKISTIEDEPELVKEIDIPDLESTEVESRKEEGSPSFEIEAVPEFVAGTDTHIHIVSLGEKNDFYIKLSRATHGVYFDKGATINFDTILNSDKRYYVIGWNGNTEKEFKSCHELKIEVSGKKIFAPPCWTAPKSYERYNQADKRLAIAEAIWKNYSPTADSHLVFADYFLEGNFAKIPSFVEIPGKEILNENNVVNLEIIGLILQKNGIISDVTSFRVSLDPKKKELKERLIKTGVKVHDVLFSYPGDAQVRWIILNNTNGKTRIFFEKLNVQDQRLTMTTPFFLEKETEWVLLKPQYSKDIKRGHPIAYPYEIEKGIFFPDLSPQLKPSEKRLLYFKVYHLKLDPKTSAPQTRLGFQLTNSHGGTQRLGTVGLMQTPKKLADGGFELLFNFILPKIDSGNSIVQIQLTDALSTESVVAEIPVQIE